MGADQRPWTTDGPPAKTLSDEAYRRLRADILRGRLTPGVKLQPEMLKAEYGIGTSPLREALSRMAAEGLVKAEGQRGFTVAPASINELWDVARLRQNVDVMALRLSIQLGDDDWEAAIVAAYHRLAKLDEQMRETPEAIGEEWERRHRAFHFALEGACASPWLLRVCEMLYDQSERYRRLYIDYGRMPARVDDQHQQIMNAALARDADTACRLLTDHIESTARIASGALAERMGR